MEKFFEVSRALSHDAGAHPISVPRANTHVSSRFLFASSPNILPVPRPQTAKLSARLRCCTMSDPEHAERQRRLQARRKILLEQQDINRQLLQIMDEEDKLENDPERKRPPQSQRMVGDFSLEPPASCLCIWTDRIVENRTSHPRGQLRTDQPRGHSGCI